MPRCAREPRERAVHRPGVEVGDAQAARDGAGDRALAGPGGAVDRHDHAASAPRATRSRAKPGYDTATASKPAIATPSRAREPGDRAEDAAAGGRRGSRRPRRAATARRSRRSRPRAPRRRRPSPGGRRRRTRCGRSPSRAAPGRPRTTVVPSANAPSSPTSGSSSIIAGTSSGATSVARRSSARAATRVPQGSPATSGPRSSRTSAPIRRITPISPVRPGLRLTPGRRTSGSPSRAPGHQQPGGRREVAGHLHVGERQALDGALDPDGAALAQQRHAGGLEHPLGVVARRRRLVHPGGALGVEAGEQQAALHLRATPPSSRCSMPRRGTPPLTHHRRRPAGGGEDLRAHRAQGCGDPGHRAGRGGSRRRPGSRGRADWPVEDPGGQAHERAGVGAVEVRRRAQPAQPPPADAHHVAEIARTPAPGTPRPARASPLCPPSRGAA